MVVHEVIIIGGGPCGLAAAIALQEQGIDYVILEKGTIVNSITLCPHTFRFYSTSDRLEIGGIPFLTEEFRPGRHELLTYYRSVAARRNLRIKCHHKVIRISREPDHFMLETEDSQKRLAAWKARALIIATGNVDHPRRLGVKGEESGKVIPYYREGHFFFGQRVMVIGGKNSAIETTIDLYRHGAHVSLVHRGESVYQGIKPSLLLDIRNLIEKGRIDFYPQSRVLEIGEDTVILETPGGLVHVANDFVLPLIGYQPDVPLLKSIGIEVDETNLVPCFDPGTGETNVRNVFLAGVVRGGTTNRVYIEDGRFHGGPIAKTIKERLAGTAGWSPLPQG